MRSAYLPIVVALVLLELTCVARLTAQTGLLAPGTVSGVVLFNNGVCPAGFWSPGASNPPICYTGIMTCANSTTTPQLNFIYSYVVPPGSVKGSVVLFSGGGGAL